MAHTALILEVRLARAPTLGEGADIRKNDDRRTVVVDATIACCGFLTRRREMCVLAGSTFRSWRGDAGGGVGGRRLEDWLCRANKVDRGRGYWCLLWPGF